MEAGIFSVQSLSFWLFAILVSMVLSVSGCSFRSDPRALGQQQEQDHQLDKHQK